MAEQRTENPRVAGSIPALATFLWFSEGSGNTAGKQGLFPDNFPSKPHNAPAVYCRRCWIPMGEAYDSSTAQRALEIAGVANKSKGRSKQQRTHSPPPDAESNFERVAAEDLPACYLWEFWREKCHRDLSVGQALDKLRKEVQANDEAIIQHDVR